MEHPSDVPVGVPFEVTLRLDQCAHRLAAGHRLRVALSTSYWPFVWPVALTPRLEVLTGTLALPVHYGAGAADEWDFPVAHVPETLPVVRHRHDVAMREIQRNLISGGWMLLVVDHSAPVTHAHGLTATSSMTETWTISQNDPASAEVKIHWSQALWRDDPAWRVDTDVEVRMTATPDSLRMTATLQAKENLAEVFRRDWDESVPRRWV